MFHVKHFEVAVDKPEVKELNKGVKLGRGQVISVKLQKADGRCKSVRSQNEIHLRVKLIISGSSRYVHRDVCYNIDNR